MGLSLEWLQQDGQGSASERLATLAPGSNGHQVAAARHARYREVVQNARRSHGSSYLREAARTIMEDAGLTPGKSITIHCESSEYRGLDEVAQALAKRNSRYVLCVRFTNLKGHVIAAINREGRTQLFDPNLGEYAAASNDVGNLLRSLADHYEAGDYDLSGINLHRVG